MFVLKLCEKNSSVNLRFEIFITAFRDRKLFGTFEKRAPGLIIGILRYLTLDVQRQCYAWGDLPITNFRMVWIKTDPEICVT